MCAVTRPLSLFALIVAVHAVGRVGAVCAPSKFDSFVYAVAAHQFYDAQSDFSDLVPDKPAGQALLTGWCYRVMPGPPSRLTLIPIDSAFLLLGYFIFWRMTLKLFGRLPAALLTLLYALLVNTYNTLDTTVAGLNVNENYLLAPMLLAVYAHLLVKHSDWRGFLRGLGIGLALTIKQSAMGLLAVFVIHGLIALAGHRQYKVALRSAVWTVVGLTAAWTPLLVVLCARGWLLGHLSDLMYLSGKYSTFMPLSVPRFYKLTPLAAIGWWIVVGLFMRRSGAPEEKCVDDSIKACRDCGAMVSFVWLWLVVEIVLLWSMIRPSAHYYQPMIAPAVLLAGWGMSQLAISVRTLHRRDRWRVWRWASVMTAVLMLFAFMPLISEATRRVQTFSYDAEVQEFADWLSRWSARSLSGSTLDDQSGPWVPS